MRLPDPEDMRKYLNGKSATMFADLHYGDIFKREDDRSSVCIKISEEFAEIYWINGFGGMSHGTGHMQPTDRVVLLCEKL